MPIKDRKETLTWHCTIVVDKTMTILHCATAFFVAIFGNTYPKRIGIVTRLRRMLVDDLITMITTSDSTAINKGIQVSSWINK